MDMVQINALDTQLQNLYGEKWPGITPGMARLWQEELRRFEPRVVTVALSTWARKNTFRVPGIDGIVLLATEIDDAQQLERNRQLSATRQAQNVGYGDVLNAAAHGGPSDIRRWARLHVEMFRQGVCAPGRYNEAASLCEAYATEHPDDAHAWRQEAAWWRGGAIGKPSECLVDREPGQEG